MKTRALIAAFALSAIVLGSGVSAFAYNGYHNYGNHAGMYAVSPEKQGAYDAMMKDYYSRVSPIQDKLNAKGIELDRKMLAQMAYEDIESFNELAAIAKKALEA